MTSNPLVFKLLMSKHEILEVDGAFMHVIPDGMFNPEEIESLRKEDEFSKRVEKAPWIANFLPDDKRPPNVKKY